MVVGAQAGGKHNVSWQRQPVGQSATVLHCTHWPTEVSQIASSLQSLVATHAVGCGTHAWPLHTPPSPQSAYHAPDSKYNPGPPGRARRTRSMPGLPAPPGMFSTTSRWPSLSPSFSATRREVVSATPPGPNGRIKRIGFVGYAPWACAKWGAATAASVEAENALQNARRVVLLVRLILKPLFLTRMAAV